MDVPPLGTVSAAGLPVGSLSTLATIAILATLIILVRLRHRLDCSTTSIPKWIRAIGHVSPTVPLSAVAPAVAVAVVVMALSFGFVPMAASLRPPVVAIAALSAVIALAASGIRAHTRLALASVVVTVIGFLPASFAVFSDPFDPFGSTIGLLDFGGATSAYIVPAVIALTLQLVRPRGTSPHSWRMLQARATGSPNTRSVAGLLCAAVAASWLWLIGIELVVDRLTPLIMVNALAMPLSGALAGLLTARLLTLRQRRCAPNGVIIGVFGGLGASTVGCAFLTTELGVVLAVASGALAVLFSPHRLPRWHSLVIAPLLTGSLLGIISLGGLASDLGFIYNGQPELLLTGAVCAAGAVAVGVLAGGVIRLIDAPWSVEQRLS